MNEQEKVKVELTRRFMVKNLCDWDLGIGENGFNLHFKSNKVEQMSGEQIEALIMNQNSFFNGTGNGDHAKLYIVDENLRKYFGFENQLILDNDRIKHICELKTDSSFETNIEKYVVLNHEKDKFFNYVSKKGYGDWSAKRLKFAEKHLDRKFE